MKYSDETKELCKRLFLKRARVPDIERETKVPRRTLYYWIKTQNWDDLIQVDEVMDAFNRKLVTLINKDDLNDKDLNAIDRLMAARQKEVKLRSEGSEGLIMAGADHVQRTAPLKEKNIAAGKKRARDSEKEGNRGKNDFRDIDPDDVQKKFYKGLFQYQIDLWKERKKRVRNILKSRQIGLTYYFAREAFADAIMTGKNQAFLSASKAQAQLFKSYIISFALEWYDVELKGGDKITIRTDHGDATLFFLSTNSSTAQGPTGNVYIDECFWVRNFKKLKDLAGAIASHKHWRKTYFSTPSTKSHEAYALWAGEEYKKIQKHRPELPAYKEPTKKQLKAGIDCVDGTYRKVITIHDALAGGCGLFDVKQLELENDPETFAQLYECRFIDDTNSAFNLEQLLACAKSDVRWPDFKPHHARPFGDGTVWIGYDPARHRDSAEVVVLAVPKNAKGKFRVLEKVTMQNKNWTYQVDVIRALTEKYNVDHIGIDATGPGSGVAERVLEFFPTAMIINYTQEVKTRLVLKAQEIINEQRIEWSEEHVDIPQAFLAIRRASTGTGITFVASRDNNIGHADSAWAIMHALIKEGLQSTGAKKSSYVMEMAA